MADIEHVSKWRAAAETEIRTLKRMGTWIEVPIAEATTKALPGTWAYRCRRSPDGEIKKTKLGTASVETYRKGSSTLTVPSSHGQRYESCSRSL
jgi:hypothetical protein